MDTPPEPHICNDFDYPSYDTVCDLLCRVKQINVISEYSEVNHQYLKLIWDNIDDYNLIKVVGENINDRGGITTLRANYYTLLHVMRPIVKANQDMYMDSWYDVKNRISYAWDGIGEWRH